MATKKFRENLLALLQILKTPAEQLKFFEDKQAFREDFIHLVQESEHLTRYRGGEESYSTDLHTFRQKFQYELDFNARRHKITVDITKNDIFSYQDTEEELVSKMRTYIREEEYEKAEVLKNYLHKLEISF